MDELRGSSQGFLFIKILFSHYDSIYFNERQLCRDFMVAFIEGSKWHCRKCMLKD